MGLSSALFGMCVCSMRAHRLMDKSKFTEEELAVLYRRFHAARFYTTQAKRRSVAPTTALSSKGAAAPAASVPEGAAQGRLDFLLFYNFLVRLTRSVQSTAQSAA